MCAVDKAFCICETGGCCCVGRWFIDGLVFGFSVFVGDSDDGRSVGLWRSV